MSARQLEDDCLSVLMRFDGKALSETQVRDRLAYPLSRAQVRAALQALVRTKRASQVRAERVSRCTYMSNPIKANL